VVIPVSKGSGNLLKKDGETGILQKEPQEQYILSVVIGMSGDNSSAIAVPLCNSIGVASLGKNTTQGKSSVVSNANMSAIC